MYFWYYIRFTTPFHSISTPFFWGNCSTPGKRDRCIVYVHGANVVKENEDRV